MSASSPLEPAKPLRILQLEDDRHDCVLIQQMLLTDGLECVFQITATRAEYEAALKTGAFDLILSDYTLPGYHGEAALAAARAACPEVPFIFVSGTLGEEKAVDALKSGATDYVLKVRLERLVPAVRRAWREAQEHRRSREAEAALRMTEERFREMAENIREVFWSTSPDGRQLHYASPAYEQIWQRPLAGLYARPGDRLEAVAPEDRPRVQRALAALAGGTPYNIEYRITWPDGTAHWIGERGYPVTSPGTGRVERLVGVAIDITQHRQLEEQLQQAQKMDMIGQLAGGIAHDFNNLLTVINGHSSLLLDNPDLPPSFANSLKEIFVAGGRAANLTRQLLIFSRRDQSDSRPVDLNEIIEEISVMLRRMIGEHINLDLDLAHGLPPVLADAGMVEQVLLNLVVNARDAMPKGGSLVITTGSCEITEADRRRQPEAKPGNHVCLSVRDAGCGIAPDILPRIFEPFFTTKAPGKGTGLGLSTVFGIIRQHQGWVEVESEVGTGTIFRVFLPVAPADLPVAPALSQEAPPALPGREVVLLVEDETSVREFACTVLQMRGYKVLQAASGVEALEIWKWHGEKIALLLTDLVLPDDITGPELAARLRARRPELKVLFCSGYNPETASQFMASHPGFAFLRKPYQPRTLARAVREMLDRGVVTPATASQMPFA